MPIDYDLEIKGLDEQQRKLYRYNEIADRHNRRAMSDSVKTVGRVTRGLAPGSLSGGVDHDVLVSVTEGVVGKVVDRIFFARWVEFGTAPHGVPSDVLAERMGKETSDAFAIARSIKAHGTRGKHFMYRAYKASIRAIKVYFERALDRITEELSIGGRV